MPGLIAWLVKMATDFRIIESRLQDRDNLLVSSAADLTALTTRLAVVEAVGVELRSLISAFKDIPVLLSKVETLLDSDRKRLEKVEERLDRMHANH